MSATVTGKIAAVRDGGESNSQYGPLHRFYLDIADESGNVVVSGGAIRQKPTTAAPQPGQEITVEVSPGAHGPMLKRVYEDRQQNSGGGSREEGQIVGWAHTLAAFELAHDLGHDRVAQRADEILAARSGRSADAPTSAVPPSSPPAEGADSAGGQPQADDDIPF